jgi:hypothetical protein
MVWKAFTGSIVKALMDWSHGRIDVEGRPVAGAPPAPALPRRVPTLPVVLQEQLPLGRAHAASLAQTSPARAAAPAARQEPLQARPDLGQQRQPLAPRTPDPKPLQAASTIVGQLQQATQPPNANQRGPDAGAQQEPAPAYPNPGRQHDPEPRTDSQEPARNASPVGGRQPAAPATIHQRRQATRARARSPPRLRTFGNANLSQLITEALNSVPDGAPPSAGSLPPLTASCWSPRTAGGNDDDGDDDDVEVVPRPGQDHNVIELHGADEMILDIVANVAPRTVVVLD